MPRWPIRVKLIIGFSLVVGMMLTLMGGSIFGLRSFHTSNLTLVDQLPELGASKDLLQWVVRLDGVKADSPEERAELERLVVSARKALLTYAEFLRKNRSRSSHAADRPDELELTFVIDHDLTALLSELDPLRKATTVLPGTPVFIGLHPEALGALTGPGGKGTSLEERVKRLNRGVLRLPDVLYRDFYAVLDLCKRQYHTTRIIVWTSALMVLAMLCGLTSLFHRWVLYPVRLLHRGVRHVAAGSFDYKIDLRTGDEMQALAEAYNDMTARLRVIYADLERQVQERSRQLVRSERLAGVGFLAAGVAHEINNPLASIAFCSEALENRLGSVLDRSENADAKVVRNYLRMIQEEAFRCKRITEKLLDFSRCSEIQRERTDLSGQVQEVVEMIRHMGKYRGKQIQFQPREVVMAHVDGQEIKQVILNLVVNALDCMESGGTLQIDVRYSGGMAEMVFADDGCGMSAEVLENIFEPFFTRRRGGKGTGLGLSITHRIVSQHQGEITASSKGEGLGSTFVVRLPARPAAESQPQAAHAPAATPSWPDRREESLLSKQI